MRSYRCAGCDSIVVRCVGCVPVVVRCSRGESVAVRCSRCASVVVVTTASCRRVAIPSMVVGCRITAVVVVVVVGVVHRVHRRRRSVVVTMSVTVISVVVSARTEAVIVVAVGARTRVVVYQRRHGDDNPAVGARPVPAEGDGLEVFEGGEAVELIAQFVVRHDGEDRLRVEATERDVDGNSIDAAGIYFDVFLGVAVTVVGIKVEVDITPIGVVADVLHVVVDRDRAIIVHHHGL